MMRSPLIARRSWVCLATLLALIAFGASAAGPKRVLILDPFGRNVAPFTTAVSSFRTTLARELGEQVDIYELPLELTRFSGPEGESSLVTFLEGRLKEQPVDLVVPVGGAGMQFAARHRERLFSTTPVLVLGAESRMLSPELLKTNTTAVSQKVSLPGLVEDILQLQPQTTNIVVVFGASALERYWTEQCRREFQVFTNRVGFTWVNDLTMEQILKRCASLPPRSFILHVLFIVDAAGVPCEKNEALRQLHEVANAPVFGYYTSELGLGSIGGRLFQDNEVGAQAAHTAVRILRGERPESIPVQIMEPTAPTYDWRELRRWGISEASLPAGSIIRFRQPTFWERYHWLVIGTSLFCLLQAALIVGLWLNRSKRKQGEAEATLLADISSKFVNLPPHEVDREIIQAQRRICQLLNLDLSVLWQVQEGGADFIATHTYQRQENAAPSPPFRQDDFPWVRGEMVAGRTVMFKTTAEIPAEAVKDRESVSKFGIKSTLTIPLAVGGEQPIGVLSFNALRQERTWPESLIKRLQLAAQIFASALARKRADHALRESEERLSLAVNSAEAGLWVMDCRTLEFWASEKARTLFGYTRDEEINLSRFKKSVYSEDWALVQQCLDRAMQAGEPINVEYRICLGDGRERWIASRGRAFSTSNGNPERLQGLSMDITERKRVEDQIRQLSHAMEQSPVLVVITDLRGNIIYVNRKFSEVTGYSFAEVIGRNPRILKSGDNPPSVYKELWACITSGKTWRGEFHNRKKNGELYWESAVISPLRDATGKLTHFVAVKEDITEARRATAEIRRLSLQLWHADRVAHAGALTASLAHELNQPLTGILSTAQAGLRFVASGNADSPLVREMLNNIVQDTKRAGRVINGLRAMLQRKETPRETIDLADTIREFLNLVHSELISRQVESRQSLEPDFSVLADKGQIQQVLLNLVMNALEAMQNQPAEQRRLELTLKRAETGEALVSLCDSGTGVPEAGVEKLFDAFWTTKQKGMGIGLAVSRSIIEFHGGRLWFANNPDRGATFYFTLPVPSSSDSQASREEATAYGE